MNQAEELQRYGPPTPSVPTSGGAGERNNAWAASPSRIGRETQFVEKARPATRITANAGSEYGGFPIDLARLPRHVAIIMDGNGRWAQERGLPRGAGHRAGVKSLRAVVEAAGKLGIQALTVYAFSTENWERPVEEVSFLMGLLETVLEEELEHLMRNATRFRMIGDPRGLPSSVRAQVENAVKKTRHNKGLTLNVALNYGGRSEIVNAAAELARRVKAGQLDPADIDESLFASCLYTDGFPDPDLCIRTGGEHRLSNFLLWQLAYAELWVTPVHWPEFQPTDFYRAIFEYQQRRRRFGRV